MLGKRKANRKITAITKQWPEEVKRVPRGFSLTTVRCGIFGLEKFLSHIEN